MKTGLRFAYLPLILTAACGTREQPPNVIIILSDDQAYGDIGFNGNKLVETPVLDGLARQSILFNNFYVSPVCAPSRASLLTGRYHQRTGVNGVTRGMENMSLSETTIADIFQQAGYKTACFGKWHNGAHFPYHPRGRGFDEFFGFCAGHLTNYFDPILEHNGDTVFAKGYITDIITDKALDFIAKCDQNKSPFFCYIPFNTPHTPVQVEDRYYDKYKSKGLDDLTSGIYGMCENIDDNVERVIQLLDSLNVRENTIIIYLSDNGPWGTPRYNAGLKGKKGSVDEGGVKVPFIISWKGHLPEGESIGQIAAHIDILPTLLDLCNLQPAKNIAFDGISLVPVLLKDEKLISWERELFMEWSGQLRVRNDSMLFVRNELYNLKNDPAQETNLSDSLPDVMEHFRYQAQQWISDITIAGVTSTIIPVGYSEAPVVSLYAHEGNLFPETEFGRDRIGTGISYYSKFGWANDWISSWTSTDAKVKWETEFVNSGEYEFLIEYTCSNEAVGSELILEVDNQQLDMKILKEFDPPHKILMNRMEIDQEAPEKEWATASFGVLNIEEGGKQICLSASKIVGSETINLKSVIIKHLTN